MVYPFRCESCGLEFSVTMSVKQYSTINPMWCPVCGQGKIKRTFYSNGVTVQYKDPDFTKYVGGPDDPNNTPKLD